MSLDTASLLIGGQPPSADLLDLLAAMDLDAAAGSVAQLTLTFKDNTTVLKRAGLLTEGTQIGWRDGDFTVSGPGLSVDHSGVRRRVTARSSLARRLRLAHRAAAEPHVSPSAWVQRRATRAGGTAVCQPSATRELVLQRSGATRQSDLDVLASLARELGWSWAEWGGLVAFGSGWWALNTATFQRTIAVTWGDGGSQDAISADLDNDTDDRTNSATGTLCLPYDTGAGLRPWDRLDLDGFEEWDGLWLVERLVHGADLANPVTVEIVRPRAPSPKAGSTS